MKKGFVLTEDLAPWRCEWCQRKIRYDVLPIILEESKEELYFCSRNHHNKYITKQIILEKQAEGSLSFEIVAAFLEALEEN